MLIYNSSKEFIGIDENDLKMLGFSNLAQLREESADFADLFVKTPGHVHNFKHVHWIDFIACAESSSESKVIISVKSKSYAANLSLNTLYLTDKPTSKAHLVSLNNLRPLSSKESDSISEVLVAKQAPMGVIRVEEVAEEAVVARADDILDEFDFVDEPSYVEEPLIVEVEAVVEESYDLPLDIDIEEKETPARETIVPAQRKKIPSASKEKAEDDSYVFDPKVASDELGLPVDLIEEFIQDFIAQAKEFKEELYASLSEGNIENVARLSHKLKGVAANLRVANALKTLSVINTSKNPSVIKPNLDIFYKIISALSGEKEQVKEVFEVKEDDMVLSFKDEVIETIEEDDFVLEFKNDAEIKDSDVPEKIDMAELADDDFLDTDIDFSDDLDESAKVQSEYSKQSIANKIGLDYETFEELFDDYVADTRKASLRIRQALSEDDHAKRKKETILLKGMSDSMHMKEFASELECLINSSDKNEMTDAINKIDDVIEKISN